MERLLEALQNAIEMERRGRDIYLDAAERSHDIVTKNVLAELARDEDEHELLITSYYTALQNHQGWPEPTDEARQLDLPARVQEMLEKTKSRLDGAHLYMDVYETALEMEMQSRDFYASQSNVADDRRLIEFFRFLARVESIHAKALELLVNRAKGM